MDRSHLHEVASPPEGVNPVAVPGTRRNRLPFRIVSPARPVTRFPAVHVRALAVVVLVAGLVVLAASAPVHAAVIQLFEAAREAMVEHPIAGIVVFVALSGLAAMLTFFSSAVLVPPAVYLWGPGLTVLLLWIGWILGGLAAYALAASAGRPALRWLATGDTIARYEEQIRKKASFGLVLLFQLALPSEIPAYVLGLARYPLGHYLAALAIAELPYAVGTMLLGASFLERDIRVLLVLGAVAVVGGVVLGRALRRQFR